MTQLDGNISLGQYLRKEREKRGLSIEQVASATKIGVRQLHALESDQYAELPAKPFIRGFVTSYSRFVGLDHKEVLTHFNSFIDSKVHERPNRDSGHSGYAFEKREGSDQSRMILGIVMGSFIVVGGIAMVVLKPSLHRHKHSHTDKLRAAHSGTPSPAGSALPAIEAVTLAVSSPGPSPSVGPASPTAAVEAVASTVSPTPLASSSASAPLEVVTRVTASPSVTAPAMLASLPTPSPTSASDPLNSGLGLKPSETIHRVVIRATDSVWVRYKVDDKMMMQFPLRKDKVLVLRARQSIIVQLGNPSHATLSHNGQGYKSGAALSGVARQNDVTYFFPRQVAEKIENPFPGARPLTGRSVPASPAPQPSPSST